MSVWLAAVWARPLALGLLLVPFALLLLVRRARAARREHTGTLPLWRAIADASATRGGARERRMPPGLLLLCAALVAGAVALAGPRTGPGPARLHRLVLDRSPSMFLEDGARMVRAVDAARAYLEHATQAADQVRWSTWDGAAFVDHDGPEPPPAWLRGPAVDAPPWELVDQPGTLWVTDAPPQLEREFAGLCSSGAASSPGPIASFAGTETHWTDGGLVDVEASDVRTLALVGDLPEAVADLARLWARARGLALASGSGDLVVAGGADGADGAGVAEPEDVEAAGAGWSARGPARRLLPAPDDLPRSRTWLAADDGRALVAWRPGRVEVAWSGSLEIEGEPAAFAVAWSRLFDRALPAPVGVTPLAERRTAGEARTEPPRQSAAWGSNERDGGHDLAPWLAALAGLLALVALGCET